MKRGFFLVLLLAVAAGPVLAQQNDDPELTTAVEAFRKALIDPTQANLDKLTMNELTYGHSSGMIQDKAAFEQALLSGASDFVSIDLSQQTMHVVGNTAWVRHLFSAVTNDGGKPGEAHLSVLMVWMKQKGQWKLLARQAVKVQS
jgi:hypothetical protein